MENDDNRSAPGAPLGGRFVVDTEECNAAPFLIIPGKKGQGGYASD